MPVAIEGDFIEAFVSKHERIHLLEFQLAGGIPEGNGKGEVIPFSAKR